MTVYKEGVYRRLKNRLAYHQKLREENRDKQEMTRCERKIRRLVNLLETLNRKVAA